MPGTINKVEILGRLGQDPELRYTNSGQAVVNLSVATDDYQGQNREPQTQWHRVTVWGKQAEAVTNYLSKGSRILVHGRIAYNTYVDRNDGTQRHSTDIVANEVTFLDGNPNGNGNGGSQPDDMPPGYPY